MSIEVARLSLYAALGALTGVAYLRALAWNVQLYCGNSGVPRAVLVHAMRLVGVGAMFVAAAKAGAGPLLAVLAGFQAMRLLTTRARALSGGMAS